MQALYHALTCWLQNLTTSYDTWRRAQTDMGEKRGGRLLGREGGQKAYGALRNHSVEASGARGACTTVGGTRLRKCLRLLARLADPCLPVCVTSVSLVHLSLSRARALYDICTCKARANMRCTLSRNACVCVEREREREKERETWSNGDTVATDNKAQVSGEGAVFDNNATSFELLSFHHGKAQFFTLLCHHKSLGEFRRV